MPNDTPPPHETKPKLRHELRISSIFASALAAVSASFAASYLGVVGTFIGAAVVSVIATIGTAVYQHSLERTNHKLREVARTARKENVMRVIAGKAQAEPAAAVDASPLADTVSVPAESAKDAGDSKPRDLKLGDGNDPEVVTANDKNWRLRAVVAAVVVFVVTIGLVTTAELLAGKPLSSLLHGDKDGGTSLGGVVSPGSKHKEGSDPDSSPRPTTPPYTGVPPTDAVTSSPTPSTEPTPSPTPEPSPSPTPPPVPSSSLPPPSLPTPQPET